MAANFNRLLPRDIQVVLFSATFPDHVHQYAAKFAPNSNEITLQHEELTVEGIKQMFLDCSNEEDKYAHLVKLYGLLTVGSSIIFVKVGGLLSPKLACANEVDPSIRCRNREADGCRRPHGCVVDWRH